MACDLANFLESGLKLHRRQVCSHLELNEALLSISDFVIGLFVEPSAIYFKAIQGKYTHHHVVSSQVLRSFLVLHFQVTDRLPSSQPLP